MAAERSAEVEAIPRILEGGIRIAPSARQSAATVQRSAAGETGRTDLPDPKQTGENAALLYDAIHYKILPLGDQTLLFPAHGAGSVCGGNIADRDESTIGLERGYNPVFGQSRADFVRAKIAERIPRPPYFSLMEKVNLRGGIPLARPPQEVPILQPKKLASEMGEGLVIDARDPEAFAAGHIPRSYSIWAAGLPVFGGWIAGPSTPVFLVLTEIDQLEEAVLSLARIGVDHVAGVLAGGFDKWRNEGMPIARSGTATPREVKGSQVRVLDVREDSEFEDKGHIPRASHLYVGYLEKNLSKITPPIAKSERVTVTCSVGHRASLAVSILRREGFEHVDNLLGGMTAWQKLELPTEKGTDHTVTTPEVEGERR